MSDPPRGIRPGVAQPADEPAIPEDTEPGASYESLALDDPEADTLDEGVGDGAPGSDDARVSYESIEIAALAAAPPEERWTGRGARASTAGVVSGEIECEEPAVPDDAIAASERCIVRTTYARLDLEMRQRAQAAFAAAAQRAVAPPPAAPDAPHAAPAPAEPAAPHAAPAPVEPAGPVDEHATTAPRIARGFAAAAPPPPPAPPAAGEPPARPTPGAAFDPKARRVWRREDLALAVKIAGDDRQGFAPSERRSWRAGAPTQPAAAEPPRDPAPGGRSGRPGSEP